MADPAFPSKPTRPPRYVIPRKTARLTLGSAAAAAMLLLLGYGLYSAAGWTRLVSPGPLAAAHTSVDAQCAQCHEPRRGAVDDRCSRCHDSVDSRRFSPAAHVLAGTSDGWKAAHAASIACAACHVEHRGRTLALRVVEDRPCATCHDFGSFSGHSEFALVRSEAVSTVGLRFSHAGHLNTLAKNGGDERCETCHRLTMDQRGFEPISFDRYCFRCHIKNNALTITGTDPVVSDPVASDLLKPLDDRRGTVGSPDGRGRQTLTNLAHRDPWLLARATRLTAIIDPTNAETANRRARLLAAIGTAQAEAGGALVDVSPEELRRWAQSLRADLGAIDRQQASSAGQLSAESKAALDEIAALLAPVDPALHTLLGRIAGPPGPPAPVGDEVRQRALDARRAELAGLLEAIRQRGDAREQRAAARLADRLDALKLGLASVPAGETALLDRLRALEGLLPMIESQEGAVQAAALKQALDLARQEIAPGVGGPEFAARRSELSELLKVLEARSDPALKRRLAELRSALNELTTTDIGEDALARRRLEKARLLKRIDLELELRDESAGPTRSMARQETVAAASYLASLQAELADLNRAAPSLPPLAIGQDQARTGLKALLRPCLYCHRLNPDESTLAPVRPDLLQLSAANFTHKPHIGQARCESCHTAAESSADGGDTLLPTVSTCQTCHRPGQAASSCASCHTYHSQPRSALGAPVR